MEFVQQMPVWGVALFVFCIRIFDVSLGTLRTISVVNGRLALSVVLGLFEISIWITALSSVLARVTEHPIVILGYAGGFATGNAVGILIERRLAMGTVVVRIISARAGRQIAAALREAGYRATTFAGEGRDGPVTLIYATCGRRKLATILEKARQHDPALFYAVEPVHQVGAGADSLEPLPHATGWRAILKKK